MKTTIIIPYNTDRGFLSSAIKSAQGQGIILESQSDGSVGYNVNRALEQVTTPFYCVLAEDDELTPNAIALREAAIGDNNFIHSRAEMFGNHEGLIHWIRPYPTLADLLRFNCICGSTTLYRTECGLWDESLSTGEEYDYHLRLLSEGRPFGFLDEVTFRYRRHAEQKSIGNVSKAYQDKRAEVIRGIKGRY
jgi:hypothetical protein